MNQAVDLDEMQLFRDMARRAFEKEISPHYEQWEEAVSYTHLRAHETLR